MQEMILADNAAATLELIASLRRAFRTFATKSNDMNVDLGVNAAMRAVLELIETRGPMTVPDIARTKQVSRQHIQVNVDGLAAIGLVEARSNPAHKRSALIALTPSGSHIFQEIRRRELAEAHRIAANTSQADIRHAKAIIDQLASKARDDEAKAS